MKKPRASLARRIASVAQSPDASFAELVRVAELDPTEDFRGADLSEVDFGDLDISGFDFSNAVLRRADLSRTRNSSKAKFSRADMDGARLPADFIAQPLSNIEAIVFAALDEFVQKVLVPMTLSQLIPLRAIVRKGPTKEDQSKYAIPSEIVVAIPQRLSPSLVTFWRDDMLSSMLGTPPVYFDASTSSSTIGIPCHLDESSKVDDGVVTAGNPKGEYYTGPLTVLALTRGLPRSDHFAKRVGAYLGTPDGMVELDAMIQTYMTRFVAKRSEYSRYPIDLTYIDVYDGLTTTGQMRASQIG